MRAGDPRAAGAEVFAILIVLQLADSAFPAGGFAHSAGLEAAVQLGEVSTIDDLVRFAEGTVWQAALGTLPLARAAFRGDLAAADARAEAFLSSHVARRASRTQGRAFAATCAASFPELAPLDDEIRAERLRGHLAPVFGAVCARLGVPDAELGPMWLHLAVRGVLSAAVRLGRIGPHEGQRLQRALATTCEAALAAEPRTIDRIAQPAPLQELVGALHDGLYSKLFQS